jgi:hypothetical protein
MPSDCIHKLGRSKSGFFFATKAQRREGLRAESLRPLTFFLTAKALRLREVRSVFSFFVMVQSLGSRGCTMLAQGCTMSFFLPPGYEDAKV